MEDLRKKIIREKNLHIDDLMSYEQIRRLHQEYAEQYSLEEFALEVIDVTPTVLEKLKNNARGKTYILRNQELPAEDKIIRTRNIIAQDFFLHQDDEIDYKTFSKVYRRMGGVLSESRFAQMYFSISENDFQKMKDDPQVTCKLYEGVEISDKEIKRLHEEISTSGENIKITPNSMGYFLELYKKYPNILSAKEFAVRVLQISENKYTSMLRKFTEKNLNLDKYLRKGMNSIEIASEMQLPQSIVQQALQNTVISQESVVRDGKTDRQDGQYDIIQPGDIDEAKETNRQARVQRESKQPRNDIKKRNPVPTPCPVPNPVLIPTKEIPKEKNIGTQKPSQTAKTLQMPPKPIEPKKQDTVRPFVNIDNATSKKKINEEGRRLRSACVKIFEKGLLPDELSLVDKMKIREYINNAFERAKYKGVKKEELDDIEECLLCVNLNDYDIVEFSKICVSLGEHKSAIGFISSALDVADLTEEKVTSIRSLQKAIQYSMKRKNAVAMIAKGDNIGTVETKTGLPHHEVVEMYERLQTDKGYEQEVSYSIEGLGE